MKTETFDRIVQERATDIIRRLHNKGLEYASAQDRLHNFKRAAVLLKSTPMEALMGFKVKHTVSLEDILERAKNGILPSRSMWDEKLGDEIAYWVLADAVMQEMMDESS